MSYFIISDGKTFKKFQTAQDHKRVQEGDKGKGNGTEKDKGTKAVCEDSEYLGIRPRACRSPHDATT